MNLDQFVEEKKCDNYVVKLSQGDLPKVSCSWRRKPRPINDNLRYPCTLIMLVDTKKVKIPDGRYETCLKSNNLKSWPAVEGEYELGGLEWTVDWTTGID